MGGEKQHKENKERIERRKKRERVSGERMAETGPKKQKRASTYMYTYSVVVWKRKRSGWVEGEGGEGDKDGVNDS